MAETGSRTGRAEMPIAATRQDGTYPRPQLVRADWTSLDGSWRYAVDDGDVGIAAHWSDRDAASAFTRSILVPFAPESPASGIGDPSFHPIVWYRRELDLEVDPGLRYLLHFGAVDHDARVWVDGQHVGRHQGGYTGFSFDVTHALASGDRHWIVVRAQDDPQAAEHPTGKQDWQREPHHIWYHRTTGIWRTVWLEAVPPQRVSTLDWRVDLASRRVTADVRLSLPPEPGTSLTVTLRLGDERLATVTADAVRAHAVVDLDVPALRNAQERKRCLWSPESPVLVDATVTVRRDGDTLDAVASYVGLREVAAAHGRFWLNGLPYYLRSVLEQGFWEGSHFTAPSTDALRDEVQLVKDLGFNSARIHQKVEDPRMLYWADRLGVLVWAETANAYQFTPGAAARLMGEWTEAVVQQRNHPSVAVWVPINESWGVHDISARAQQRSLAHAVTHLTRALDPSRPVVSNDGWEHVDSDIFTVHDYSSDPDVLASRYATHAAFAEMVDTVGPAGRRLVADPTRDWRATAAGRPPIIVSEFGGVASGESDGWGYSSAGSASAFAGRLRGLFGALQASPLLAGFCYTQLTDTLQEVNGLLDAARRPKLPIEQLRAIVLGHQAPSPASEPANCAVSPRPSGPIAE